MTMDITALSSNWKKLQSTLKTEKKQEHATTTNAVSVTLQRNPLKRKASETGQSQSSSKSFALKRQKTSVTQPTTFRAPRKMGAYVSSLIGTSSESSTHPKSTDPTQDIQAPPLAHPALEATSAAVLQDSTAAGKYVSIDCEMVGTHSLTPFSTPAHNTPPGSAPEYSILARVSLISYSLVTIYDAYVLPPSGVTISDYRTQYSGITPWHLTPSNNTTRPKPFETIQREVSDLIADRILVGHSIKNDLAVLGLGHPRRDIRDTARHPPFRQLAATVGKDGKLGKGRTPSLKKLAAEVLGWGIQDDEKRGHSSVEDAKATMALFRKEKAGFEREHVKTYGRSALAGKGKKVIGTALVTSSRETEDDGEESEDDGDVDDNNHNEEDGTTGNGTKKTKKKGKRKKRTKR